MIILNSLTHRQSERQGTVRAMPISAGATGEEAFPAPLGLGAASTPERQLEVPAQEARAQRHIVERRVRQHRQRAPQSNE